MSWSLTDQGIFVRISDSFIVTTGVVSQSQHAPVIKFYSFATGHSSVIREFPADTKMFAGFSVSPDGQWIIYTQVDQSGSDLMLMENYR